MTLIKNLSELSAYALQLLTDNALKLGLQDVYDGPQSHILTTPAVVIQSDERLTAWDGAAGPALMNARLEMQLYIDVYHGRIGDTQTNYRDCMLRAEAIEDVLHLDKSCGGLVIYSYVNRIQPGVARAVQSFYRITRITWYATSKALL